MIETLLNSQKSCIINGRITTHYFKFKKGTRKSNAISAYLFILVLEAVFCVIISNKNINGLNTFNHELVYIVFADDTTFFLRDKISVLETLNIFHKIFLVFGLSTNNTKCETASIVTLKAVNGIL